MNKKYFFAAFPLLVAISSTASADAYQPFTIDETSLPGVTASIAQPTGSFEATKITGGYSETITQTGANAFSTIAYINLGSFFSDPLGSTPVVGSQINSQYQLYAIFSGTGTDTVVGGQNEFTGGPSSFALVANPLSSAGVGTDTFALSGDNIAITQKGVTDTIDSGATLPFTLPAGDILLESTNSLTYGNGLGSPGNTTTNKGSFTIDFNNSSLTNPAGLAYFSAPHPFYTTITLDGNFSNFPLPTVGSSADVTGSANVFVNVPEPASLALLGIGLLGLVRSRKI